MMPLHPRPGPAALLAALALALCGAAAPGAAQTAPAPPHGGHGGHAAAPAGGVHRPHTAADVHFMSAMIGHHAQAIEMARLAPTHGASPSVRTLAARIISAQQDEIATMQQWLRERGQPVPEAGAAAAMHHGHGAGHGMQMPGMLTQAQLRQLDAARGAEFDRLLLTFMIQHHRGAVSMVQQLFGTHGAGQDETVFKFASDVNVDQVTEIARMQRMLAALLLEEDAS